MSRVNDTNTVIAVLPKVRRPAAVAMHLRKKFPNGNFLPGTLVASAQGRLPEVGDRVPRDVPQPQGLGVVLDGRAWKTAPLRARNRRAPPTSVCRG